MTLKQLENKVSVRHGIGYNLYEVTIEYRGKKYNCKSNNSLAWDRIHVDGTECYGDRAVRCTYTYKQALVAFWEECKRLNGLGEYNY